MSVGARHSLRMNELASELPAETCCKNVSV